MNLNFISHFVNWNLMFVRFEYDIFQLKLKHKEFHPSQQKQQTTSSTDTCCAYSAFNQKSEKLLRRSNAIMIHDSHLQ